MKKFSFLSLYQNGTFLINQENREELKNSHKSAVWEGAHTEFSAWHYQACYLYLSLCGEQ